MEKHQEQAVACRPANEGASAPCPDSWASDRKKEINEMIWMHGRDELTLAEAEKIAAQMLELLERAAGHKH